MPWKDNTIRLIMDVTAPLSNNISTSLPTIVFILLIHLQGHIPNQLNSFGERKIMKQVAVENS
jgi:hypothetical protein